MVVHSLSNHIRPYRTGDFFLEWLKIQVDATAGTIDPRLCRTMKKMRKFIFRIDRMKAMWTEIEGQRDRRRRRTRLTYIPRVGEEERTRFTYVCICIPL
jgi:hypothetical protein